MGYSCTALAGCTEEALRALIHGDSSNSTPDDGFYEVGREQPDGAITGTVFRPLNAAERARWADLPDLDRRVQRAGSFRINADGTIKRFPGIPRSMRQRAEINGRALYRKRYGFGVEQIPA